MKMPLDLTPWIVAVVSLLVATGLYWAFENPRRKTLAGAIGLKLCMTVLLVH